MQKCMKGSGRPQAGNPGILPGKSETTSIVVSLFSLRYESFSE